MQYNLGPSLEDPLIRWRRKSRHAWQDLRRAYWIHSKLFSFYRQQTLSLIVTGLLVATLHPASVAQAADAAGAASAHRDAGLADFTFDSIEEVSGDTALASGFIEKPLVVATDMGKPERELVAAQQAAQAKAKQAAARKAAAKKTTAILARSTPDTEVHVVQTAETGNSYPWGYCTWYAKQLRPDLPNHLGDAKYWLTNAARAGFATGTTPAVGAVVVTSESRYGHVGYVAAVDGDTIVVQDMNVIGFGKVSKRWMKITSPVIRGYIY